MASPRRLTPLDAANEIRNANNGQVVLVLQGGGALGAYQGGVYQALHEAGIEPDWLIGTSIGAINASIIAGNAVEDRLAEASGVLAARASARHCGAPSRPSPASPTRSPSWTTLTTGIPGFFETNLRAFLGAHVPLGADHAGYYSTEPLRQTLEELVDFSLINAGHPRLTVGAAHVRTSMMHYFDSKEMDVGAGAHHGVGRAAAGLPRRAHRRRALLGRRHSLQHADRAHLRRSSAAELADLRRASVEPDRRRARPPSGRS